MKSVLILGGLLSCTIGSVSLMIFKHNCDTEENLKWLEVRDIDAAARANRFKNHTYTHQKYKLMQEAIAIENTKQLAYQNESLMTKFIVGPPRPSGAFIHRYVCEREKLLK